MKNLILAVLLSFSVSFSQAQFVTIPDANFVTFLQSNYPSCMTGSQMDTTCVDIVNTTILNINSLSIADYTGIQYFDNLIFLNASDNDIVVFPSLYTTTIKNINISNNPLLTTVGTLPTSLKSFLADGCVNIILPSFPFGIEAVYCANCNLSAFPVLPNSVKQVGIQGNPIVNIPFGMIPTSCTHLNISNCPLLSNLPILPPNLLVLTCNDNSFATLGPFPQSLEFLYAHNNPNLSYVFGLPDTMNMLRLKNCAITAIDSLPNVIIASLDLSFNNLTSIPNFPDQASQIILNNNNISSIPEVSSNVQLLKINNNNISCWPVFPSSLMVIEIQNNPFHCLPNYIPAMANYTYLDTMPLCSFNNTQTNPAGCSSANGIEGKLFEDLQLDCSLDGGENPIINVPMQLLDGSGNIIQNTSSGSTGRYHFQGLLNGTYTVLIDTVGKPFSVSCANPGADSSVTVSALDSLISDVNFGFICNSNFDVGIQSINPTGIIFPGQTHLLKVLAGDITNWYGLNCTSTVSGVVSFSVNGPVSYAGIPSTALTPAISGSTYTYTIADFANVNLFSDFAVNFETDTTAQAGDSICISVVVTPTAGDADNSNNTYTFCYEVFNSYDPNDKQVFPTKVEPGYDDWLTYTIRFQNTGNAPAFNIRLEDTLSALLDYETFEVIGYKHVNIYNLIDDRLVIYFPNIMLPDSTSNEPESKGYFQYRIKPISGLQAGTDIENTAYIFFDFNAPIITNTAVTSYKINDLSIDGFTQNRFIVFPNPSTGKFYLKMDENYEVKLIEAYTIMGQSIPISYNQKANLTEIEIMADAKGICFINIITDQGVISKKMLIE